MRGYVKKGFFETWKNIWVKYLCGAGELGWEFTIVFITRVKVPCG
jgi:hypothetical protein